ncbi:hypothetical protein EV426DRAFT_630027 [Tirmania nivea]|nr:hypothetical protein EV426DRAFT_630027 [Tirmania nivea]
MRFVPPYITKGKEALDQVNRETNYLRHQRDQAFQEIHRLEGTLREVVREAEERQNKILAAHEHQNKMHQQRVEKFAAQIENKELFLGNQESDGDIEGKFNSLSMHVKSWSSWFKSEHQVDEKYLADSPRFREIMYHIAPDDGKFELLGKKGTRRLCIQGIVGYWLVETIFRRVTDPDQPGWPAALDQLSHGNADAVDKIERALVGGQPEITRRELNDWRAFTVGLISRIEATATATAQTGSVTTEQHIASVLRITSAWAKRSGDGQLIKEGLKKIMLLAMQLALMLRKQRACWSVKFPPPSATYDPQCMSDIGAEDEDDENREKKGMERQVLLWIFPGLYKQGNADGEHYDRESCIVKSTVKLWDCVKLRDHK